MEFKALDKDFNLIDIIAPTNVQWNRRYYEPGDFVIEIPYEDYDSNMQYVYCTERTEVGMIQKVQNTEKNVLISGFFLEKWLDDKIIYPTFYGSGEITHECTEMINQYKEDIPITSVSARETGSKVDFQSTGDELSAKIYEVLQTQEMSYRLLYDYLTNDIGVQFYKGADKTQNAGEDDYVTFSTSWDNLSDQNVVVDKSNFKNFFVVAGTGQADERITVEVDLSNGGYKKKLFVDERNTKYNPDEQTLEQYKLELQQKGLEKSLDYQIVENVDFIVDPTGYEYLVDYDLGTKVDVVITKLQLSFEVRITAIYEVFKEGTHTIEVEVGTPIRSKFQNIRL